MHIHIVAALSGILLAQTPGVQAPNSEARNSTVTSFQLKMASLIRPLMLAEFCGVRTAEWASKVGSAITDISLSYKSSIAQALHLPPQVAENYIFGSVEGQFAMILVANQMSGKASICGQISSTTGWEFLAEDDTLAH